MNSREQLHEPEDTTTRPTEERPAGALVAIDPGAPEFRVPHCARCGDPVALNQAYRRPGPFCEICIDDIFASVQSYGGEIGELALRYNAKLRSFVKSAI